MQTSVVMQLRNRPAAFIRSMVDAATVRPFWSALRDMKQARVAHATAPAGDAMPPLAPAKAA